MLVLRVASIITVGCLACKQPTAQVKAIELNSYKSLAGSYSSALLTPLFDSVIDYEKELTSVLAKNNLTATQHTQLLKIQQHVRSIIAYAVHSRCFKVPRLPLPTREGLSQAAYNQKVNARNWQHAKQFAERDWRDRYDYNYHLCDTKKYKYQILVDDTSLCHVFLAQLKELSPDKFALPTTQAGDDFFQQVMANKVKSLNEKDMRSASQKIFNEALAPQITRITEQNMARTDFVFPFHRFDYVKYCEARRGYYFESEAGERTYRYPSEARVKVNCQTLRTLPAVKIKTDRKVDCAQPLSFSFARITTPSFADLSAVAKVVNETVQGMNTYRAELDKLVKLREVDKIKSAQAGKEKHYAPYREKKPWLLPFMKFLNATKLTAPPVVKAVDAYHCHLVEAAKHGVLPLILAQATQKETGSVHLNHMGRFFGFGKVEYKPLKLPMQQALAKALDELKRELVASWLDLHAAQVSSKAIEDRKIYATMLNNEFAVAQLLLQNPAHTVVVSHLLRKFQHAPTTPKWLRLYKNFALGADLAFVPIAIFGGFMTGGIGIVPILLLANAVNFLWVGGAAAGHIIARQRYRMVERALLTGNSEQITRGLKVLRAMHEKRRDLIASGAIGAPLTLSNLSLIARGLDTLVTVPIDITAAFSSDIETISMPDEIKSDADLYKEK